MEKFSLVLKQTLLWHVLCESVWLGLVLLHCLHTPTFLSFRDHSYTKHPNGHLQARINGLKTLMDGWSLFCNHLSDERNVFFSCKWGALGVKDSKRVNDFPSVVEFSLWPLTCMRWDEMPCVKSKTAWQQIALPTMLSHTTAEEVLLLLLRQKCGSFSHNLIIPITTQIHLQHLADGYLT